MLNLDIVDGDDVITICSGIFIRFLISCKATGNYLEGGVGAFEFVTLLHSLGTTILGVAAVLQRPPFLLESDYLLTRKAVQFFVEFTDRE